MKKFMVILTILASLPFVTQDAFSQQQTLVSTRVSGSVRAMRVGTASFILPGQIDKLHFEEGDLVKSGAVLAKLDTSDAFLRKKLAQNGVQQALIAYEQAKKDLERELQLQKEKVSSDVVVERVQTGFENAKISLDRAKLNLEQVEKSISDAILKAPFGGMITKRMKVHGEYVNPGNAIYEITEIDKLEVSFNIPETLVGRIKEGMSLTAFSPSIKKEYKVKVRKMIPLVNEKNRAFQIIADFEGKVSDILVGQFLEASIP